MANAPGWKQDPERHDQERYWSGSAWTDRVRPAGKAGSLHLPEHVPHLQRALSAATAGIDAVEDRLTTLFERSDGDPRPGSSPPWAPSSSRPFPTPTGADVGDDEIIDLFVESDGLDEDRDLTYEQPAGLVEVSGLDDADEDGAFAELDAALAAEEPDEPDKSDEPERSKRRMFRRS
jgi:hypothetical protein